MTKHFRGKFFSKKVATKKGEELIQNMNTAVVSEDSGRMMKSNIGHGKSEQTREGPRPRKQEKKPSARSSRASQRTYGENKGEGQSQFAGPKFVETDDPYNVKPGDWLRIGLDIERSNDTVPSEFCGTLRNWATYCHHMKAAEWKLWTLTQGPIYPRGVLEEPHYSEYLNPVEAIRLSTKREILEHEIDEIETRFLRFSVYYELVFYGYDYVKLGATLPVMHQCRHTAITIRKIGHTKNGE